MESDFNLTRVSFAVILLLLLSVLSTPQSVFSSQSPLILEIVYTSCGRDCESDTVRVYADGRYVSETIGQEPAKSGRPRNIFIRHEKQLEPEELAELVNWAEQPDFLNAKPEYVVKIVTDGPAYFIITYRNKIREKQVKVFNFNAGSAEAKATVPPSVLKLARWALPYSLPE